MSIYNYVSKEYLIEIGFLILIMISLFVVALSEKHNGRLEMCQELGMYYLKNGTCITAQEAGFNNFRFDIPEIKVNMDVIGAD